VDVPFNTINDSEAVTLGLGTGRGETLRVVTDRGEERLHCMGLRFRWRS
jgi:hypothetical protein